MREKQRRGMCSNIIMACLWVAGESGVDIHQNCSQSSQFDCYSARALFLKLRKRQRNSVQGILPCWCVQLRNKTHHRPHQRTIADRLSNPSRNIMKSTRYIPIATTRAGLDGIEKGDAIKACSTSTVRLPCWKYKMVRLMTLSKKEHHAGGNRAGWNKVKRLTQ